jgi:hypothetical protein
MSVQTATVTDSERVAWALRKVNGWVECLEANAAHNELQGREKEGRDLRFRASELRDVIAMLDGTEDAYIAQVTR